MVWEERETDTEKMVMLCKSILRKWLRQQEAPENQEKCFFFVSQASLMIEEKQNGERTIKD